MKRITFIFFLLCAFIGLFIFHAYAFYLILNPSVSPIYKAYYIDRTLDEWIDPEKINYTFGNTLSFHKGGKASNYFGKGFSGQEEWGTWTDGKEARLYFIPDHPPKNDILLTINGYAFLNTKHTNQIVDIYINDVFIKTITYTIKTNDINNSKNIYIPIQKINTETGFYQIKLKPRNPASPAQFSQSDDTRMLGVGISSIIIKEMPSSTIQRP